MHDANTIRREGAPELRAVPTDARARSKALAAEKKDLEARLAALRARRDGLADDVLAGRADRAEMSRITKEIIALEGTYAECTVLLARANVQASREYEQVRCDSYVETVDAFKAAYEEQWRFQAQFIDQLIEQLACIVAPLVDAMSPDQLYAVCDNDRQLEALMNVGFRLRQIPERVADQFRRYPQLRHPDLDHGRDVKPLVVWLDAVVENVVTIARRMAPKPPDDPQAPQAA